MKSNRLLTVGGPLASESPTAAPIGSFSSHRSPARKWLLERAAGDAKGSRWIPHVTYLKFLPIEVGTAIQEYMFALYYSPDQLYNT